MIMTEEILKWLDEKIIEATRELQDGREFDRNSYAAGYDQGLLDAFNQTLNFITKGKEDD